MPESGTGKQWSLILHILLFLITSAQAVTGNREDYEKLTTELATLLDTLAPYVTKLLADDPSGRIARILL